MLKKIYLYLVLFGVAVVPMNVWAQMTSSNYIIWADVFSIGGSEGDSSANYKLSDSIGEAMILSATSTSANYGVKAGFRELYADQFITFAVDSTDISLGILSTTAASTASHTMSVDTNATGGFTITVSGITLTNGANQITAIGPSAEASVPGNLQFGINLVANTSPSVGANPSGTAPIGSVASPYDTVNNFAYNSGDTVASATNDINTTTYTVSYIANIPSGTVSGIYATTLTYAATANF